MSIGASCGSLFFMKGLGLRIPGPVDNLDAYDITQCIKLLNGDFYNSIINKTYHFADKNIDNEDYPYCFFDGFGMIHNDFRQEKTQKELLKRYNRFLQYLEEAKSDKEMFFVLSHNCQDINLNDNNISYMLNNIPQYIKDRLIIIGEIWLDCGVDPYKFPNIPNYPQYFVDISILRNYNTDLLKEDFKKWWIENKSFYEEKNNCTYE